MVLLGSERLHRVGVLERLELVLVLSVVMVFIPGAGSSSVVMDRMVRGRGEPGLVDDRMETRILLPAADPGQGGCL